MRLFATYILIALCLALTAVAENADDARIEQKLNAQVPLDAKFTTSDGETLTLAEMIDGDKPVLLSIVFYRCPTLCNAQMNSVSSALMDIDYEPAKDYQYITISMDHTETAGIAHAKKRNYLEAYNRPGAEQGWIYTVGEKEEIRKVSDAVGFYFYQSNMNKQYVHKSALIVLSPEGKVMQYLFPGVFDIPDQVRFALVNAGQGKVGTFVDKVFLRFCASFDPEAGEFGADAMKIMRYSGIAVIVLLVATIVPFWFMGPGRRQNKQAQTEAKQEVES